MKLRRSLAALGASLTLGALGLAALALSAPRAHAIAICSNLQSTRSINPGFSDLEKRLACGEGSDEQKIGPEWRDIPEAQRQYFIRVFLQARGYQHPRFVQKRTPKGQVLWVDPGSLTRVTGIHVDGAPDRPDARFDITRRRGVIGQPLTPQLLDDLKSWTRDTLRMLGFACPKIQISGNPDSGLVSLEIQSGPRDILAGVIEGEVPGLMHGIFRRYDAFQIGGWFNGQSLDLTGSRVVNDGQVQSYKLVVDHCQDDEAFVRQDVVAGKPHLLTLGFGANTEGVLIGTAEWKNTRLGDTASLLDFQLYASTKEQILSSSGNWYFLDRPSRLYLKPLVSTDHQNQTPYETIAETFSSTLQTSLDTSGVGVQFGLGPNYQVVNNLRGSGQSFSRFLFLEPTIRAGSHAFDFYQTSPRTGFLMNFTGDFSDRAAFSDIYAQRLQLNFEGLWNLNDYSPPLLIFGVRGAAVTLITNTGDAFQSPVPPTLRQYLGGSNNLRGFGLLELPVDQVGRFTSITTGFETRLASVLPWGIQPFTFVDIGALGRTAFDLDPPVYWSPGFGLRVQSPIGVFRGTLAHGYLTGNPDPSASHFQFFLSYGEEF